MFEAKGSAEQLELDGWMQPILLVRQHGQAVPGYMSSLEHVFLSMDQRVLLAR